MDLIHALNCPVEQVKTLATNPKPIKTSQIDLVRVCQRLHRLCFVLFVFEQCWIPRTLSGTFPFRCDSSSLWFPANGELQALSTYGNPICELINFFQWQLPCNNPFISFPIQTPVRNGRCVWTDEKSTRNALPTLGSAVFSELVIWLRMSTANSIPAEIWLAESAWLHPPTTANSSFSATITKNWLQAFARSVSPST